MRVYYFRSLITLIISLAPILALAAEQIARQAVLETGEVTLIPKGYTNIPGQPFVLSDADLKRTTEVKEEIERTGYVSLLDDVPLSERTLALVQSEIRRQKSSGQKEEAQVYRIANSDLANTKSRGLSADMVSPESEGYALVGQGQITNVYTNTTLGNIYVRRMPGAKMGVVEGSEEPNISINGSLGHLTTIRYKGGAMTMLFLARTSDGVILVETGGDHRSGLKRAELEKFLGTLLASN